MKAEMIPQDSLVKKTRKFELPDHRIGLTLTSITHIYPTTQLSYDKRVSDNTEWSVEAGFTRNRFRKASGFRIRPSIERYILRDRYIGFFVGGAINNMNIWELYEYSIFYENSYFREFSKLRRRPQLGGYLSGGFKINLGGKAFLELSSGIGQSFLFNTDIEQLEENIGFNVWSERNGWSNRIGFYSNLNLSFPLNQ